MKTQLVTLTIASLCLFPLAARAQEVTNMPDGTHHAVGLGGGFDSAVVGNAGYTHRFEPGAWQHDVLLQAKLTMPLAEADPLDLAFEGGVRTTLLASGDLRLQASFGPLARITRNEVSDAYSVGLGATLLPGYQSERWGLMGELGYEKMLSTYFRHTDELREIVYDARDGYYGNTAGTFRLGLRGGARVGPVEISARIGATTTEQGKPLTLPFYATLGASYAF